MKRESLKLSAEQWAALETMARQTESVATTTAEKRPSWRTLIRRLADGELSVTLNSSAGDRRYPETPTTA